MHECAVDRKMMDSEDHAGVQRRFGSAMVEVIITIMPQLSGLL